MPPRTGLPSLCDYASWVAGEVRRLRRPRILLGHGIGGSILLEWARSFGGEADGLILHAPVGAHLDRRWLPRLMKLPYATGIARWAIASPRLRPLMSRLFFHGPVPEDYRNRFFDEYAQCAVFARMFEWIDARWFRSLRPVSMPTVLLWGDRERVLPPEHIDCYIRLIPGAYVHREPGWGHFPMVEQPAHYARVVCELARALLQQRPHPFAAVP